MTAQIAEVLIINRKRTAMHFCPPLPPDGKLLLRTQAIHSESTDEDGITRLRTFEKWVDPSGQEHVEECFGLTYSTACWREYIGTWQISDGHFWLLSLTGRWRLAVEGPLLADWFTGVLRIPRGSLLHCVHMGFGSVFERELHIAIERGRVMGRRMIDNTKQEHDTARLGWQNLPGRENRFRGDRDFN